MKTWRWLPALVMLGAASGTCQAEEPDVVLTGTLTGADHQSYHRLPFEVPPGVDRLDARFRYERDHRTTIDLGLEDPERFRGWSGGNKSTFWLTESAATPSYLPGPLPAGQWHLVLGVPNLREGVRTAYRAEIVFSRGSVAFSKPFAEAPVQDEAGWYRGDLHAHSGHSDGSCLSQAGRRIPCPAYRTVEAAAARGLDFLALTEHNAVSHHQALAEMQPAFDRMVLLPAREITTFYGHFNVFGTTGAIDFRAGVDSVEALLARAGEIGGLVSINHPALPSDERCLGCGWQATKGLDHVAAVEVINGAVLRVEGGRTDGAASGIPFWEGLLDRGMRVTAIAGSDNHDPALEPATPGAVGSPATVIHATALSQPALLEGLRSGRVFVDVEGSRDRVIDMAARALRERSPDREFPGTSDLQTAAGVSRMGGSLTVDQGEDVHVTVRVLNLPEGEVRLIHGGEPVPPAGPPTVSQAELRQHFRFVAGAGSSWIRAEALDREGHLLLLANPIYLNR